MKLSNKLFAECLGTFRLVLGGCGTAIHLVSIPLTNTSVNHARSI